jgi:N-acetylmuramoyl-L-alanine amidase
VGVRQAESRRLAESVQGELVSSLRRVSPEVGDRGVKSAPFVVLIASEMPGILAEVSCVSNAEEARLLHDTAFREAIADALARGVRAYADAQNLAGAGRSGNG